VHRSAAYFDPISTMRENPVAYNINFLLVANNYIGEVGMLEVHVETWLFYTCSYICEIEMY